MRIWHTLISHIASHSKFLNMKKTIYSKEYRLLISMLREIRINKEITQNQLAEILKVDQTFISKIETCERRIDVIELKSICGALKVSLSELIIKFEEKL